MTYDGPQKSFRGEEGIRVLENDTLYITGPLTQQRIEDLRSDRLETAMFALALYRRSVPEVEHWKCQ